MVVHIQVFAAAQLFSTEPVVEYVSFLRIC